jgi:hypothetical protein
MAYGDWTIGGKVPVNIESVERNPANASGNSDSTLTFHCVALAELLNDDPRTEVEAFNAMSCQIINNDQLLNGGSKLQPQGGDVITITEHTPAGDVDYTAALEPVKVVEDSMADQAIWYDLIAHYELSGKSQGSIYLPPYYSYSNMVYDLMIDADGNGIYIADDGATASGNELGKIVIAETKPVRYVQVKGSCCWMPGNWIEINGIRQYWNKSHEGVYLEQDGQLHGQGNPQGHQVMGFDLSANPSKTITITTSPHYQDFSKHQIWEVWTANYGCWLEWIRTVYK